MKPQYAAADSVMMVSPFGVIYILAVFLTPIALVIWFVRYLMAMSEERRRLRLEVSKLAHELEGIRNEMGESKPVARESSA